MEPKFTKVDEVTESLTTQTSQEEKKMLFRAYESRSPVALITYNPSLQVSLFRKAVGSLSRLCVCSRSPQQAL